MSGLVYYRDKETGELVSRSLNAAELAAAEDAVAAQLVPASVSPRQFRLAVMGAGISLAAIEQALDGNAPALVEWEYSTEFRRDHPMLVAMAADFGLDAAAMDALFIAAAQL